MSQYRVANSTAWNIYLFNACARLFDKFTFCDWQSSRPDASTLEDQVHGFWNIQNLMKRKVGDREVFVSEHWKERVDSEDWGQETAKKGAALLFLPIARIMENQDKHNN